MFGVPGGPYEHPALVLARVAEEIALLPRGGGPAVTAVPGGTRGLRDLHGLAIERGGLANREVQVGQAAGGALGAMKDLVHESRGLGRVVSGI
eukprot:5203236-Lingulodinium_polyedra.AAC.1